MDGVVIQAYDHYSRMGDFERSLSVNLLDEELLSAERITRRTDGENTS